MLIADDNVVIRQGLRNLLDAEEQITVVGEASTGAEAIQFIRRHPADVALMDIRMPVIDGIGATAEIMRISPETKVLVLTVTEDPNTLAQSIIAGAKGYLVYSHFSPDELLNTVYAVASGKRVPLSPAVALALENMPRDEQRTQFLERQQLLEPLTPRESEILDLIADGKSNAYIAQVLVVEEKTVKNHITRLYSKLNINSRY
ncbi:MAG: response regulator transcription factor [Dehalococcoidia bacterium]|nr:MAG: response regulator transcription factor [Dehalococcoidia bacterium]